jgi:thioredoxin-related protein
MANKSVNNIKFLNEDDTGVVPPGCYYAMVLKIAVRSACFYCELRKDMFPSPEWRLLFVEAFYASGCFSHTFNPCKTPF